MLGEDLKLNVQNEGFNWNILKMSDKTESAIKFERGMVPFTFNFIL